MHEQFPPEKSAEIAALIAYLDGLLSRPKALNRLETLAIRKRLDSITGVTSAASAPAVVSNGDYFK
jgi:hypothetical protein